MSLPALNLLRHPRRWHLTPSPMLAWGVSGLVGGVLAAAGWGIWCEREQATWLQQRQDLRARLARQSDVQAEAAARAQQARLQQQLEQRHKDWQAAREQQIRLHALLVQASADSGLRLQRWQGDGQRLQLQGWLPQTDALTGWQTRLSQLGPPTWTWQSLAAGAGGGMQWVMEASRQPQGQSPEGRRP